MKRFDCLEADCPLFGPHLLEASAGTGKTFSIEHVFVRLLLESIQLEEILVVTFTRAATRELKARIRSNIEKACAYLRGEESPWPYLKPYIGSAEAIRILNSALGLFDRCQIFTIHGFCYRMLKEFAFEANLGFSLSDPDGEKKISKEMRRAMGDFFEKGVEEGRLCPEQVAHLISKYESVDDIARALIRASEESAPLFSELHRQFEAALRSWPGKIEGALLREDFENGRVNYKARDGDFPRQIEWLAKCFEDPKDPVLFRKLIWDKGSLFAFFQPSNRKVRVKEMALHYPSFFDWAALHLKPIVDEASNQKKIFASLALGWKKWQEEHLSSDDLFQPDEILARMKKAIESEIFVGKLRGRFKAAIIDEFQDTDPLQWEIFRRVFLESEKPLRAFYLVGDPKQSIYRFRRADVYTYFSARDYLGEQNLYQLDTNFRSTQEMIGALNTLFDRKWLPLPRLGGSIPYYPVKAGREELSGFTDGKGALHWIIGDEESFLPYAVLEIEKLGLPELNSIAILVKDRHEAKEALDLLRSRGIPAIAKSHQPLGQTAAFRAIRELLEAVAFPNDDNREKIVQSGPFSAGEKLLPLSSWKNLLEEKGLAPFFRAVLNLRPVSFDGDFRQTLEELFDWERMEGFSFEGLKRFLDEFEKLDADEGGRRRVEDAQDAVQILTTHISKGLEFEVVFALGLASRPSKKGEEDVEELDAEKLRQLYVAMTRAKKRIYVPYRKSAVAKGPYSPMELFCRLIETEEGPLLSYLERLGQKERSTFEEISSPIALISKEAAKSCAILEPPTRPVPFSPSYLNSFTSLARPKEGQKEKAPVQMPGEYTLETLPRGTETGIAVHQVFETLFSSEKPIWRDDEAVGRLVENELRFSSLALWSDAVRGMVLKTLSQRLSDGERVFSLKELNPDQIFVEMEFLYPSEPHFVKGFIDLVFCHEDRYYLLDWKTNWLKETTPSAMNEEMEAHDYGLQASLYAEALRRHLGEDVFEKKFGGAFYIFVRSGAYVHFKPSCHGN